MDFPRYAAIAIVVYFVSGALLKKLDDLHTEEELPEHLRESALSRETRAFLRFAISGLLLVVAAVAAWAAAYVLALVLGFDLGG